MTTRNTDRTDRNTDRNTDKARRPHGPRTPAGTRVRVQADPVSREAYSYLPPDGTEGVVASIRVAPGRSSTYFPGPGGGLLYVACDTGPEIMGISPWDLVVVTPPRTRKRRPKPDAEERRAPVKVDLAGLSRQVADILRGPPAGVDARWRVMQLNGTLIEAADEYGRRGDRATRDTLWSWIGKIQAHVGLQ
jgi:hypothetical protein